MKLLVAFPCLGSGKQNTENGKRDTDGKRQKSQKHDASGDGMSRACGIPVRSASPVVQRF